MTRPAYYNEFEPYCAAWLRNLIAAGHLPAGDVDERDIRDVRAADLAGYGACHWFAGIGGWAYALRLAGWPDERAVWTGSCPCQPLSSAGQRKGHADERHLWPAFHGLIAECRPPIVFGEQVAGKDGREWLAAVRADLEDERYAVGAADLCSAGAGATDIRQRLYWVADALLGRAGHPPGQSLGAQAAAHGEDGDLSRERLRAGVEGAACRMADADGVVSDQGGEIAGGRHTGSAALERTGPRGSGGASRLDFADGGGRERREVSPAGRDDHWAAAGRHEGQHGPAGTGEGRAQRMGDAGGAGLSPREREELRGAGRRDEGRAAQQSGRSFWSDAEWLPCTDGKYRPVEPGTFPLGHGLPARVGRLRAYGNAINPWVAKIFIEEFISAEAAA